MNQAVKGLMCITPQMGYNQFSYMIGTCKTICKTTAFFQIIVWQLGLPESPFYLVETLASRLCNEIYQGVLKLPFACLKVVIVYMATHIDTSLSARLPYQGHHYHQPHVNVKSTGFEKEGSSEAILNSFLISPPQC